MSDNSLHIVAVFGIPEFEQKVLERIFGLSKSRPFQYAMMTNASPRATICVLDKNNPSAVLKCEAFQAEGRQPIVEIVADESQASSAHFVRRPFTATRLLGILDQIVEQELSKSGATNRAEMDLRERSGKFSAVNTAKIDTESLRALVVDDSGAVRKQVGIALQRSGIGSDFAETGEQALTLIEQNRYDIIFLDVVMPGVDGYEVCKSVKRNKEKRRTPVVMLTGRSSPFDRVKGKLSGCDTYLTKPVSFSEFKETLSQCLRPPRSVSSATGMS